MGRTTTLLVLAFATIGSSTSVNAQSEATDLEQTVELEQTTDLEQTTELEHTTESEQTAEPEQHAEFEPPSQEPDEHRDTNPQIEGFVASVADSDSSVGPPIEGPLILASAALVAIGVGLGLGAHAQSLHTDAVDDPVSTSAAKTQDSATNFADIATGALSAGALGLAVGAAWLILVLLGDEGRSNQARLVPFGAEVQVDL